MAPVRPFHHTLHHSTKVVKSGSALPYFAPTRASLIPGHDHGEPITWTSRNHRKHRHVPISPRTGRPRHTSGWARIAKMSQFEYWNISWWVAVMFTLGSVVWVINGFVIFLPLVTSVAKNPAFGGWSAWVGATIFEVGSLLLILEAWNRHDAASFGPAIEDLFNKMTRPLEEKDQLNHQSESDTEISSKSRWIWWSTDRKYWHELGFVAGFTQLVAASVFWISGFTAIPQIQDSLSKNPAALDGAFWTPQVVGGTGFIISSVLYMLETQRKWYLPAPASLGWHVGFWNFIGAIGFTLSGALGYSTSSGAIYQSSLATFWGSWAFLLGSLIQWYEAVNPVQAVADKQSPLV